MSKRKLDKTVWSPLKLYVHGVNIIQYTYVNLNDICLSLGGRGGGGAGM